MTKPRSFGCGEATDKRAFRALYFSPTANSPLPAVGILFLLLLSKMGLPARRRRMLTHLYRSPISVRCRREQRVVRRSLFCMLVALALVAPAENWAAGGQMTPWERAVATPKGQLESPYPNPPSVVVEEGYQKYMAAGCNGCHGGGGGGGMAAPLTNPVWIYGDDDDTLFRVIALGTGTLSPENEFGKLGYRRTGSEAVVGPMPDFGEIVLTDDDLWKIIAWMRSVHCKRRSTGC